MHVERYGTGPELYLGLHGWSGDHRTFRPIVSRMPESASLYSADLPGYGRSCRPTTWNVDLIVDEIADAIRAIGGSGITIIGNCSGANLALLVATRMESCIARLVLLDTFAYFPWYFSVFVSPVYGRYAYSTAFANPIGRWLANRSLKAHRTENSDLTRSFVSVDHEVTYNYLLMLSQIEGIEQFRNLSMAIDIVYGKKTFGAVKQSASKWKTLWPHARIWELKGAGHLPIEEAPDQLSDVIFRSANVGNHGHEERKGVDSRTS